ncbi:MAG: serine protease [Nitrospirota bacterium]
MTLKNIFVFIFSFIAIFPFVVYGDDNQIHSLIPKLEQSTIMIFVYQTVDGKEKAVPLGSGFIATEDGLVITANHVVRKDGNEGIFIEKDKDGKVLKAEIKYRDEINCKLPNNKIYKLRVLSDKELLRENNAFDYDYAILKIIDMTDSFNYLEMGDYSTMQVGDSLLFAGFPLYSPNLIIHNGMVSSKYSSAAFGNNKKLEEIIQIDGSINKGNSGGPVLDIKTGKVVGIINTRYVGITPKMDDLRKKIAAQGSLAKIVEIYGVSPMDAILELINIMDATMNVGIGQAVSINYIKEDKNLTRATPPNNRPKD